MVLFWQLFSMIRNFFVFAVRNLRKNRVHSFINIAGLAAGMAITLLIGLWIADELSFDHYAPNHQRIGVAMHYSYLNEQNGTTEVIPMPWGAAFGQRSDLFVHTALTSGALFNALLSFGEKAVSGKMVWAQMELPQVFGFRFVKGGLASAKD